MTPNEIRSYPTRVLTEAQREFYFDNGYLLLEGIIGDEWIERLRAASDEFIERSRSVACSDAVFDLEPDHRTDAPRLRRISSPDQHHPTIWEYFTQSVVADIAAELVGPDVAFHHSKLNYKWAKGGEEVKWHYDIGFWPHTNYSPLTVGTLLYDCGMDQGPLGVIPGSHDWELAPQYDEDGKWIGCLNPADLARVDLSKATYLTGPAGSLTLHNCRMLHGSPRNQSASGRPLLLCTLASADARPYTLNPLQPEHAGSILRGKPAAWAHHDPRPCPLPPDWSRGYSSIFALQQRDAMR